MPVFVARHAEREDYQWKSRGESWQIQAARPWDTPLTAAGHEQGVALGQAIAAHCARLGLPAVTRCFTSPLLRCGQTAAAACGELGVTAIAVEPSLSETCCEEWYRSWALPDSDSTWGGGPLVVAQDTLHPAAVGPASHCHHTPESLSAALKGAIRVLPQADHTACWTGASRFTWGSFETEEQLQERMGGFVEWAARQFPDESVLCLSHGGPTAASYSALIGGQAAEVRYTGLFAYCKGADGEWTAPVAGDDSHVTVGTRDGPSSAAEQGRGV